MRRRAQHAKRGPHRHAGETLRIAFSANRLSVQSIQRQFFKRIRVAEPVVIVRHACRCALDAGLRVAVVNRDEAVGFGNRKRPQQNAIDNGENGCVGTDTHAQRQNDRGRKAAILPKHTPGGFQIVKKPLHRNDLRKNMTEGSFYRFFGNLICAVRF